MLAETQLHCSLWNSNLPLWRSRQFSESWTLQTLHWFKATGRFTLRINKLFTDLIFWIFHDAWGFFYYPRWMDMFVLLTGQRYSVCLLFLHDLYKDKYWRRHLSPISKFRFVFNNILIKKILLRWLSIFKY